MRLRDFIPPAISPVIKRLRRGAPIYGSYADALAACDRGYGDSRLTQVVYEKTKRLRDTLHNTAWQEMESPLAQMMIGPAAAIRDGRLRVIDFGGACGAHYLLLAHVIAPTTSIEWAVVETAEMVEKARCLEDGRLRFFTDLQQASEALGSVDLVFSSGALQYTPVPTAALGGLLGLGAEQLYLCNLALHAGDEDIVSIQRSRLSANGPGAMPPGMADAGVSYPVTFMSRPGFERAVSRDHRIRAVLSGRPDAYRAGGVGAGMFTYVLHAREAGQPVLAAVSPDGNR